MSEIKKKKHLEYFESVILFVHNGSGFAQDLKFLFLLLMCITVNVCYLS